MAWATLGTVFNQGSTLVSNIAIANVVGRAAFGEYAIVLATVQATTALTGLGIGYTATRYLAEWRHRDPERAGRLLGLFSRLAWGTAAVAAVLLGLGSSEIAGGILRAPQLGSTLIVAAATAFFMVRNGFLLGALAGLEAFRRIGFAGMVSGTAYLGLTAAGAAFGGVAGAAIGLLLAATFQWAVLTASLVAERRAQGLGTGSAAVREERSVLFGFAVPAALSGLTTVPVLWSVQALVARSVHGFDAVAVYAAGLNFLTIVLFAPTVINGVAMPWINRRRTIEGPAGFRQALRSNLLMTAALAGIVTTGMIFFGPWLLAVYGQSFRAGYGTVVLLLLASLPESLTLALNQSLQAHERMWQALAGVNVPRDLAMLAGAWLLVPRYGANGAAAAYLLGRLVALVVITVMVRSDLGQFRRSAA